MFIRDIGAYKGTQTEYVIPFINRTIGFDVFLQLFIQFPIQWIPPKISIPENSNSRIKGEKEKNKSHKFIGYRIR